MKTINLITLSILIFSSCNQICKSKVEPLEAENKELKRRLDYISKEYDITVTNAITSTPEGLKSNSEKESEKTKKTTSIVKIDWNGRYGESTDDYSTFLKISNNSSTGFNFEISNATKKGCFGSLEGKAKIIESYQAIYKDNECIITFTLLGNLISIKGSEKCSRYSGAACSIYGDYPKN